MEKQEKELRLYLHRLLTQEKYKILITNRKGQCLEVQELFLSYESLFWQTVFFKTFKKRPINPEGTSCRFAPRVADPLWNILFHDSKYKALGLFDEIVSELNG